MSISHPGPKLVKRTRIKSWIANYIANANKQGQIVWRQNLLADAKLHGFSESTTRRALNSETFISTRSKQKNGASIIELAETEDSSPTNLSTIPGVW